MNARCLVAVGVAAIALTIAHEPAHAQNGSYAAAALAKPITVTIAGGTYNYDFLSDGSFPFGALRVGRDIGRYVVVETGAQVTRLSTLTQTAPDATTYRRVTFPQTTVDGTLQLQAPISIVAPYIGMGLGYYHLAPGGSVQADNGLSRIGLAGLRVGLSQRAIARVEIRGRSDQHRGGNATDVELGGGLGFRF